MPKLTQEEAESIAQFWADLPAEVIDGDEAGYAQERWEVALEVFTQEMDEYLAESGYPNMWEVFNTMSDEGRAAPLR